MPVKVGNGVKGGLELARTPPVIVVVQDGVVDAVQVPVAVPVPVAIAVGVPLAVPVSVGVGARRD